MVWPGPHWRPSRASAERSPPREARDTLIESYDSRGAHLGLFHFVRASPFSCADVYDRPRSLPYASGREDYGACGIVWSLLKSAWATPASGARTVTSISAKRIARFMLISLPSVALTMTDVPEGFRERE